MKNNHDIRFYDTSALLINPEEIFEQQEWFFLSSITLKELEGIKTAANKDPDVKYSARLLQRFLEEYPEKYEIIFHTNDEGHAIYNVFPINDDIRILGDALTLNDKPEFADRIIFVTNDLALKHIANLYLGDGMIESISIDNDTYKGYLEICPTEEELCRFYQEKDYSFNQFNLRINQYLILKDAEDKVIDIYKWNGRNHIHISQPSFTSTWFGKVSPYKHDIYQQLLCDSLVNNKITMARGPAGSGKSYLALAYLMSLLQKDAIDKIIIFCNTVATANSAKLGFYPGSKDEKLLDSQIGNFLASKFGGKEGAIELIEQGKLLLLPFSDLRGFDTTGMNAGIYITEAQNLDRTLMKLALQRVGEDCICIIDGDDTSQVDMKVYEGSNNGMKRLSKVFRGHDIYGEVTLKNIYRSRIAEIADNI